MKKSELNTMGSLNMIWGAALSMLFLPAAAIAAFAEIEVLSCKMTSQQDQETVFFTLEINEKSGGVAHVLENGMTYHVDGIHVEGDLRWSFSTEILPGASIISHYALDQSTLLLKATLKAEMDEGDADQANTTEYIGRCSAR